MSMNVGPSEGEDEVLSQINTTPLVDVMLVMLIIFLITIPVVTTSVKVELPQEVQQPRETKPEEDKVLKTQYSQAWARAEAEAYYQALATRYKVEKKVDPLAAAVAAPAASAKS